MSPRATGSRHTDGLLAEAGYRWTGDHGDHDLPQVLSTAHGLGPDHRAACTPT
ncbi:hypothetical protein [Streptomyces sp. CBMA123]|uniref:hypothetical protein n=1 Tax=Streptomyces sp. CBMA123 TaxID=1896313 RepID=UPI001661E6EA|nr:hypothetical protein [Streptomyces sp. CBMA123]